MRKREFRKLRGEIRVESVGGNRKIVGYGAIFNSLSEPLRIGNRMMRERVMPGAFDRCLRSRPDIRGLLNHNADYVLGRTSSGTMRVGADAHGLRYEIDPPDTSYARDLIVSLERGDINQSSFGFYTVQDNYVDDGDGGVIRELRDVDCFDVSPVTYPAYTGASSGLRAQELRSMFPDGIPESVCKEKRANDEGCDCDCPECMADDCENCSMADCEDEECAAAGCPNEGRSITTGRAAERFDSDGERRRLRRELMSRIR